MGVQKLQVGMAGLGRVGKFHATNFLERTPRAQLVAAFTPDPNELSWGRINLEPHGITLYDNYDEMLKHPGLQAVAIGTATSVHAEEAIKAIDADLHVLCEKPLSIHIDVVCQFESLGLEAIMLTSDLYSADKLWMLPARSLT